MRNVVEQIKRYYVKGVYKLSQVNTMLNAGKITQEEYDYIVEANE